MRAILFVLMTLSTVIMSNAQTYEAKDVAGKYQFKVTWVMHIETNYQIKRNGSYKLVENFEGKIQKSRGKWKISGDTIILSPLSPETGSLCIERRISIWIDSLENVHIGNFKRFRQKHKNNLSASINSDAVGWNSLNSDSLKFIAIIHDNTRIIFFTEEGLDQSSGCASIDLKSVFRIVS